METHTIKKDSKKGPETKKVVVLLVRYFKIFPPILMIAILIAGYIFLIEPKYDKTIHAIGAAKMQKELEYKTYESYFNKLNELMRSYQGIALKDREKLNYMLPDRADPEELFVQLESIVYRNGLILDLMGLKWEEAKDNSNKSRISAEDEGIDVLPPEIGKIIISVNVSGVDYTSLKNLLNTIENNLRLIDVYNIEFEPEGSISLVMHTYYLREYGY